jgi:hypothetical protein
MRYSESLKSARLRAVVQAVGKDAKLVMAETGKILAVIPLEYPCGKVEGDTLVFATPVSDYKAVGTGTVTECFIETSDGEHVVSELEIGKEVVLDLLGTDGLPRLEAGQRVTMLGMTIKHG